MHQIDSDKFNHMRNETLARKRTLDQNQQYEMQNNADSFQTIAEQQAQVRQSVQQPQTSFQSQPQAQISKQSYAPNALDYPVQPKEPSRIKWKMWAIGVALLIVPSILVILAVGLEDLNENDKWWEIPLFLFWMLSLFIGAIASVVGFIRFVISLFNR